MIEETDNTLDHSVTQLLSRPSSSTWPLYLLNLSAGSMMKKTMTKKKKILVFSIFTFTFAAAAAAILDILSQSFWKNMKKTNKKKIQMKPNPDPDADAVDRISELPIEILHCILGFLDMDEVLIQTSLVSTKWRNLWKSVPVLKFTCIPHDNGGGDVEKYHNFVDHVLRLRDSQASKIRIFKYSCDDSNSKRREGYDYFERIHNNIVSAVNQGAQEIQIMGTYLGQTPGNNMIHFNPSIFNSGLLRVFTFDVTICSHAYRIQFPRSMCCATQLTHLCLSGIVLPEGGEESNAELHLVCPVLKTLVMRFCNSKHLKVLDISAPRLNTLSICNIGMRNADFDGLGECRIEIRTPNLTSLELLGNPYVDYFMENLPRIADATLQISKEPDMLEKTTSFAIKLLKGLTSAKSLFLEGFEVFSQDTLRDLLTPFTSLRTLWLLTSNISGIQGMLHFLNSCNSIEELGWVVNELCTVDSDAQLMLPQCRLSHLQYVHIHSLHGHKNEIELVKFLLKNSVVLEDIIIITARDSSKRSIEENLKQFIEEEPSVRKSIKLHIF